MYNDEQNNMNLQIPMPEREMTQEELDSQFSGDLNDILEEITGVDDVGASRSVVLFTIDEYTNYFKVKNADELKSVTKRRIDINFPIIDIVQVSDEYTMITMKFKSDVSSDLRGVWEGLSYYEDALSIMNEKLNNNDDSASAPILTLTFMPKKFNGDYFVLATSPIFWILGADKVGEKAKEIRFLFKSDDVCYMQSDLTEAEKQQIKSDVQRELMSQAEWEAECARKDAGY